MLVTTKTAQPTMTSSFVSVEDWLKEMVARLDEATLIDLLGIDKQGHRRLLLMKAKEIVL
jgi:hypothetical protein